MWQLFCFAYCMLTEFASVFSAKHIFGTNLPKIFTVKVVYYTITMAITFMHILLQCVYVQSHVIVSDITCSNAMGGWSDRDVFMDVENSNSTTITCITKHLTSFAVLVDHSGTITDNDVSGPHHVATDLYVRTVNVNR